MGNNAVQQRLNAALDEFYAPQIYDAESRLTTGEGLAAVEPGIERLSRELMVGDQRLLAAIISGEAHFDTVYERFRHAKVMDAVDIFYAPHISKAEGFSSAAEGMQALKPAFARLTRLLLRADERLLGDVVMGRADFGNVYQLFRQAAAETREEAPDSTPLGVFRVDTAAGDIFIGSTTALRGPAGDFAQALRRASAVFHRTPDTARGHPRLSEFVRAIVAGERRNVILADHELPGGYRVRLTPFRLTVVDPKGSLYGHVDLGEEFVRAVSTITCSDDLGLVHDRFMVDLIHRAGHARKVIASAVARSIAETREKMTLPQGVKRTGAIVPAKEADEAMRMLLANPDAFIGDEVLVAVQRALAPIDQQLGIALKAFGKMPLDPIAQEYFRAQHQSLTHAMLGAMFVHEAPLLSSFEASGDVPPLAVTNAAVADLIRGGGLSVFFDLARLFRYRELAEGGNARLDVRQTGQPERAADAAFFYVALNAIASRARYSARHGLPLSVQVDYDALSQLMVATYDMAQPGHLEGVLRELVRIYGPDGQVSAARGEYGGIHSVMISREPPKAFDGGTTVESPAPDFGAGAQDLSEGARATIHASMSLAVSDTIPPSMGATTMPPSMGGETIRAGMLAATMPCMSLAPTNDTIPASMGMSTLPPSMGPVTIPATGTETIAASFAIATIPCTPFKAG